MTSSNSDIIFSVEDILLYILSYATVNELLQTAEVSSSFSRSTRTDVLWRPHCNAEFGVTSLTEHLPPDFFPSAKKSAPTSFFQLFLEWSQSFSGYRRADVKAIFMWWTGIEQWCAVHASPLIATLNPPASESDLTNIDKHLMNAHRKHFPVGGRSGHSPINIPYLLRLVYRFHNGQKKLNMDGWGIFGGTLFYDSQSCMRLLPLEELVDITSLVWSRLAGHTKSHEPPYVYRCQENYASDVDLGSSFSTSYIEDCIVFSRSTVSITKFYCVGRDKLSDEVAHYLSDYSSPESRSLPSGCVFVNNSSWDLNPCHPVQPAAPTTSNSHPKYLILWLNEFLRRLREGVYTFQPQVLTSDTASHEELSNSPHMISLYPMKPLYSDTAGGIINIGATRRVSRNVEVIACPAYIPEKSNPLADEFFWSYSIRMRLLTPSDPDYCPSAAMECCQLTTRHWVISEPSRGRPSDSGDDDESDGYSTQRVDGEGVIGLYPVLSRQQSETTTWPFAYQSCVNSATFPGKFGGHMKFVPGTASSPRGGAFEVNLAEFKLSVSQFIY